jgi:regulator of ribonuclease activity A
MNWKTTDLCDACADAQVCELPFLGFGRRRRFAGAIRTVRCDGGLAGLRDLVHQPAAGQVLVVDAGGLPWRAVFGDVMGAIVGRSGWEGIVVNGWVRDRVELDAMDIGVKALGTVPRRADTGGTAAVDVPVRFGHAMFTPGAWLVADDDGVVVLPPGVTEADLDVAGTVAATATYAATRS